MGSCEPGYDMGEYTFATKALHHIALDASIIKKIGFDIDCAVSKLRQIPINTSPPVFIAGLARAGTTILLEALYSTDLFATLTYRDMPFVTSPFIWRLLTANHRCSTEKLERAHGDGLYVNFDSPEAFEEVFWMTFTDQGYVKKHWLEPQVIDEQLSMNYRKFVTNIITRSNERGSVRYLAKNNNNVLRIKSLKHAFPESLILVPFRNPFDHARSLFTQHQQFRKVHSRDPFSLRYMNWLGHFEFGENFKPFRVSEDALPRYDNEPNELKYWLRYWTSIYEYLIQHHSSDVIFFDYDGFCGKPEMSFDKLAGRMSIDLSLLRPFCEQVKKPRIHENSLDMHGCSTHTQKVYEILKEKSLQRT